MMFDRAVNFVRSNIPESLVEKATPYYNQAQGYATPYIEQAQSMKTKIADKIVTTSTTLKETSTTYVTGAAERLDNVLIDNGNKLSSKYLGREVINFHFKEALTKLAAAKSGEEAAKKKEQQPQKQESASAPAEAAASSATAETKEQAASSIANLFTTLSTSTAAVLNNVTSKISQVRAVATDKVKANKDRLVTKAAESRNLAVKSVAGACSLALKGRDFAVLKQQQYVPAHVSAIAQKSVSSIQSFSAPYLQRIVAQTKNLDSTYLQGATFSFVEAVNTELFPVAAHDNEEEVVVAPTTATATVVVAAAPTAAPVEKQQQDDEEEEVVVPAACTPKEQQQQQVEADSE